MSNHNRHESSRSWLPWLFVVAALLVSAAGVAVVAGFSAPIRITVDGVARQVPRQSTVADLRDAGYYTARPGNLLSVTGGVVKAGGGQPALVTRNGRPVSTDQQVYDGDVVVGRSGQDVFEQLVTAKRTVAQSTVETGTGPILKVLQPGAPGVEEVRKGAVSGIVYSAKTITPSQDMVVIHADPSPSDKLVALTFDDGPWLGQTDKILDILKQEKVKATFFMLGGQVKAHPELARRVYQEGHLIGDHTLSHKDLTKQKPAEVKRQIVAGADAVQRATGFRPAWFRPPFGALNSVVWTQARKLNVRVVLWGIDTNDWRKPGVDRIVRNAEKPIKPGAIILMHDGGGKRDQTIAALPRIIADLRAQGYNFVTLDVLAAAR